MEWARTMQLGNDEREFLDESVRAEHSLTEAETRRKRQHVRQLAALATLLVVAIGAGVATYARAELEVAQEKEALALKAQREAGQIREELEVRAKAMEEQAAAAQAEMKRASAEAEAARKLAAETAKQVAAAKRGVAAAQKQQLEAMQAAELAKREAEEAETRARVSVEASAAERSELLRQAKELGSIGDGSGKASMRDVLADVQKRTATMARKIARLEAEIQPLASENLALHSCRLMVEAQRGEGRDLLRMRVGLEKVLGVQVQPAALAAALAEANRAGAICPGPMKWDDVQVAAAERLRRK